MSRHILMTAGVLLCLTLGASAQAPSPDAMSAARSLVTTMKLGDQYKALLPVILLNLKPTLVQDRPEIERDYDAMTAMIAKARKNPAGLNLPRRAAISAGRPKMLAPTMVLTMSAARLQRPMVRTSPV